MSWEEEAIHLTWATALEYLLEETVGTPGSITPNRYLPAVCSNQPAGR